MKELNDFSSVAGEIQDRSKTIEKFDDVNIIISDIEKIFADKTGKNQYEFINF